MSFNKYTVTVSGDKEDFESAIKEIENMGAQIESTQEFIGTAVVKASPSVAERVRELQQVKGITESLKFSRN